MALSKKIERKRRSLLEETSDDYDNTEVVDMSELEADTVKESVVFGSDLYTLMWQPVGDRRNKIFRSSVISTAIADTKRKRRAPDGRRMWFYTSELPTDYRDEADSIMWKYICPLANSHGCTRKLQSAYQLMEHVRAKHGETHFAVWKDRLEKYLKEEIGDLDLTYNPEV